MLVLPFLVQSSSHYNNYFRKMMIMEEEEMRMQMTLVMIGR